MDIPDSLQTVADIGVALAAFSGLIVVLRKDTGPLTPVQKYRLQILLLLAFGATFLSLLPELLLTFGITTDGLWWICNAVLTVYSFVFLAWWVSRSRQIRPADPGIFNRNAFIRMIVGHAIVLALQIAYLSSATELNGAAVFLAGLFWYLLHSVQQFTRMLFIRSKSDLAQ